LREFQLSLVAHIKDKFLSLQTAICDLKSRLVEWFVLVVAISVGCPHLIGMLVLLRYPPVTVPQLSVAFITGGERV